MIYTDAYNSQIYVDLSMLISNDFMSLNNLGELSMQFVLFIFSVILYFIMRKQNTKVASFLKKYRSIIIILFGVSIPFLFNNNAYSMGDIAIPILFLFIGIYYFVIDSKKEKHKNNS